MISDKLKQDIIFTRKLIANTSKNLERSIPGTEINKMLASQLERLKKDLKELGLLAPKKKKNEKKRK
jgi:hypothetical protein